MTSLVKAAYQGRPGVGITDNGLLKMCTRMNVPLPPQGFLAGARLTVVRSSYESQPTPRRRRLNS